MAFTPVSSVQLGAGVQGTSLPHILSAYLSWTDTTQLAAAGLPNFAEMHFDAVISEEHDNASEVTEHTVEQGAAVVDHVRPLARRVTLEVFTSNTPIGSPDATRAPMLLAVGQPNDANAYFIALNAAASATSGNIFRTPALPNGQTTTQIAPNVDQFVGAADYPLQIFNNLEILRTTATLLNVNTPKAYYTDMVLEAVKMSRSPKAGTGAYFTLMLREIRFVNSSVVAAPAPSIPSAAPTVNKGKTDVKPPPAGVSSAMSFDMQKSGMIAPNPYLSQ